MTECKAVKFLFSCNGSFLFQKKLHTLTMESERLKSEITSRNDLLTRIDGETEVVEAVSITGLDKQIISV